MRRELRDEPTIGPASAALKKITVVIMTKDRTADLMRTLRNLTRHDVAPHVLVVDNGSNDETPSEVQQRFPDVELIALDRNIGVEARNLAARLVTTPYIAFNDDDSWWEIDSLIQAVAFFEAGPALGAITAHILVGPDERDDATSIEMQHSPVEDGHRSLPGVPVLGFLACATAARRSAFLDVGGFEESFHFGGEEQLLALDLVSGGWAVRYIPDLVVHHHPNARRDRAAARRCKLRNTLWFLWLRRPVSSAIRRSVALLKAAPWDINTGRAAAEALAGMPRVLTKRRVVPSRVERSLRRLERHGDGPP